MASAAVRPSQDEADLLGGVASSSPAGVATTGPPNIPPRLLARAELAKELLLLGVPLCATGERRVPVLHTPASDESRKQCSGPDWMPQCQQGAAMSRHLQIARARRPPRALLGSLAPGDAPRQVAAAVMPTAGPRPGAHFASARGSVRQRGETPRQPRELLPQACGCLYGVPQPARAVHRSTPGRSTAAAGRQPAPARRIWGGCAFGVGGAGVRG